MKMRDEMLKQQEENLGGQVILIIKKEIILINGKQLVMSDYY